MPPFRVSNVLEFETARSLLHGAVLRAVGLTDVMQWRVRSQLGAALRLDGLSAAPALVAVSRARGLCVAEHMAGARRMIARSEQFTAQLDAAVVCAAMFPDAGSAEVCVRWVFDHGDHLEVVYARRDLSRLLGVARRWMQARNLVRATTRDVARALAASSSICVEASSEDAPTDEAKDPVL